MSITMRPGPGSPLAVVVGAGGMGMVVARRLGVDHRVLLADRDSQHLDAMVEVLRAADLDASGVVCDVTDTRAVAALADAAAAQGPVQAVAHVVGLSPSAGDAALILRVDLAGAALVADAFLPVMGPGGAAVFVSSMAGHGAPPAPDVVAALDEPAAPDLVARVEAALGAPLTPALAYVLAKWAVIRMCRQHAASWGARGARLVSLSPGLIDSPMGAREFEQQPMKHVLLERTPLGRQGTMDEVADAVAFLVSARASFVHGTDLLVDGGITAAMEHGSAPA